MKAYVRTMYVLYLAMKIICLNNTILLVSLWGTLKTALEIAPRKHFQEYYERKSHCLKKRISINFGEGGVRLHIQYNVKTIKIGVFNL